MNRLGFVALACAALSLGVARPAPAAPAPTVVTLRNGLRVLLAPDSAAMAADVGVWYPAGTRWEAPGLSGVSHLSTRLMFRGSARVPDGAHVRQLLAEGATVNFTNTPDGTCYWQTVPAEALALALRLEADRMAGLATTPAVFEAARADARADRRLRAGTSPIARGLARLVATAFPGGYGRPLYGDDADLQRMTPRAVEAWRRAHYGAGSAVLTIVGRFEPEATLAYVRSLFEPLPRGTALPPAREPEVPAGERRDWSSGPTPLRILFAGWRGPGAADPDAPVIELLGAILGAEGSHLKSELIQEWKVAVVTESRAEIHRDASLLWVAAALPADADSSTAERVLVDAMAGLTREPIGEAEVARVRARLLNDALFASQPVRARAAALGEALFETGDPAAADRRIAALERVTPADIQRVAQRIVTDAGRSVCWYVPAGEGR